MKTPPTTKRHSLPVCLAGSNSILGMQPMNVDQTSLEKRILKDPVAEFCRQAGDNNAQKIDAIKALSERLQRQKRQYKEIQTQSRVISRKIGEAKRDGKPIDEFMTRMQKQSKQARAVEKQLHETRVEILGYFKFGEGDKNDDEKNAPAGNAKLEIRRYPGTVENSEETIVSQLGSEVGQWNSYVESNPAASIYHRAEWRQLIYETFGHDSHYLMARDNSGIVTGILPLIRLKSRLFGDFLVSVPYFNYGGAIADHPQIERKLMAAADEHAERLGCDHVEYRDDVPRTGFPVRTEKVNMILKLPNEHKDLWRSFSPKLRSQIKRPQRENPQISHGGSELLDNFYAVFSRNMRDLGTPVYGKNFFRNILDSFPEQSSIMLIRLSNRPVAAAFLLGHGDTLEIPWASTLRAVNHYSINMLLYWEVLQFAVKKKYRYFDFGRSSKDSGTYKFKQQWGAEPKPLYWHYWLGKGGVLPSLNPSNPKYALLVNVWKRLPIAISNVLGPMIVKNLP